MREVHLPAGATERDLELAEQVAVTVRSGVLLVCWTEEDGPVAPSAAASHPLYGADPEL